ncbi:MAF protein [Saprospira grandis DSM 2844]|uniref:dTTP/UTP pyrophosphatase n=1 Tax=Saprospira grandis DSM 2844 TaxID=694433 RepID=J0XV99_9BACT|nr:Maf family protein [Saprospira grandis]EJF52921.1 MAF protein [Saprospira grandis DSM 2844]
MSASIPLFFPKLEILLASKSPRRQQLLRDMGLRFQQIAQNVEEDYPPTLPLADIALFLAQKKARSVLHLLKKPEQLLLCSDTTVIDAENSYEKPQSTEEAKAFLRALSGKTHEVRTAVCLWAQEKRYNIVGSSKVEFAELTDQQIEYYVTHFQPFDKAGSYAIQEWIGLIGIKGIQGSYFNIVGLPSQQLFAALCDYQTILDQKK